MRKTFLHKTISCLLATMLLVNFGCINAEVIPGNQLRVQELKKIIKENIQIQQPRPEENKIINNQPQPRVQPNENKPTNTGVNNQTQPKILQIAPENRVKTKEQIINQTKELQNKPKPEDVKKAFSGAIQKIQQMTPEMKSQLINVAKERINNIKTEAKQKIEVKKQEIIKDIKQDIQKQKNIQIEEAKRQFEIKKQEILYQAKSGKIGIEEARNQIISNKNVLVEKTKVDIKAGAEKLKQEKISNVKSIIKTQFETKLADLSKLSNQQQKAKYIKLDASIDKLVINATKAQNEVYNIMREVLREKIDSIK